MPSEFQPVVIKLIVDDSEVFNSTEETLHELRKYYIHKIPGGDGKFIIYMEYDPSSKQIRILPKRDGVK